MSVSGNEPDNLEEPKANKERSFNNIKEEDAGEEEDKDDDGKEMDNVF